MMNSYSNLGNSPSQVAKVYVAEIRPESNGRLGFTFLGQSPEPLLEMSIAEMEQQLTEGVLPLVEPTAEVAAAQIAAYLQSPTDVTFEFAILGVQSAQQIWVRCQLHPRPKIDGPPDLLGVFIDITSEKVWQSQQSRYEQILAAHQKNSPLLVLEWSPDFRLLTWPKAAEKLFGWSAEEVLGKRYNEIAFVHQADLAEVDQVLLSMARLENLQTVSRNRNYRNDGRVIMCEWHNSILLDERGQFVSLLSIVNDLTEHAATQEALARSEYRLKKALSVGNMIVWDYDIEKDQIFYSHDYGQFIGMPEVGANPGPDHQLAIVHPDYRARFREELSQATRQAGEFTLEFPGASLTPQGQQRWFLVHANTEFDPSTNKAKLILGVTIDITDRKHQEEMRAGLVESTNEARRYESLGMLAGGLAHDFNNLLTMILGNASLIRLLRPQDADLAKHLDEIERAGLRAAELCSQMTAYAGVGRVYVKSVSVNSLLVETMPTWKNSLPPGIQIRWNLAQNLPLIQLEPRQFCQAVLNVLFNAAEAMTGVGTIQIETTEIELRRPYQKSFYSEPKPGPYVFVRIIDSGIGMSPETLQRVYEPFYSTKFAGRGLGLAAVLGIVRAHQGALSIQSSLGHGCVVELYFPVQNLHPADATPNDNLHTEIPLNAQNETIIETPALDYPTRPVALVVDDELNIRELIGSLLEDQGFEVLMAHDGRAAMDIFQSHARPTDLAIVDLMMPDMNGYQLIRQLREHNPGLPVIVISGYTDRSIPEDLRPGECLQFIEKPFRLNAFTSVVQQIFAKVPNDRETNPTKNEPLDSFLQHQQPTITKLPK